MKNIPALLKKHHLQLTKKLGQNFLKDEDLMDRLIDPLDLYPDEDLLEIGFGLGLITEKLSRFTLGVLAVDKDPRMVTIARKEFGAAKNIRFIEGDFLKLDLEKTLRGLHLPIKVFGNIPYNISSALLFKLLEHRQLFQIAVLTLQKEVAERLVAEPGSKDYGVLTIMMQLHTTCEKLFDLEPGSFIPPPQVTSTAVRIQFLKQSPYPIHNPKSFQQVVKLAFQQRRKTIRNALRGFLKGGKIKPWEDCGIDPEARPETLTTEQFVKLANFLK